MTVDGEACPVILLPRGGTPVSRMENFHRVSHMTGEQGSAALLRAWIQWERIPGDGTAPGSSFSPLIPSPAPDFCRRLR